MPSMLDTVLAFGNVRVAVLGDAMLDRYVFGDVGRISPEAPIPIVKVLRQDAMLGGAGNVARNIVRMGGSATLVSVLGDDAAGVELAEAATREARLEACFVRDPLRSTTVKTRFVAQGQQLLRVDQECTLPVAEWVSGELLSLLDVALERAAVLVCSDYAKGVITAVNVGRVIARARGRGIAVIVDPKSTDFSRYRGATIITPNCHEAARATGIDCDSDDGVVQAARAIVESVGCRYVVITRGAQGMTVVEAGAAGAIIHLKTEVREVHDVSGAGDTVVATLALALAAETPIELAARIANVAAGISVGKSGTAAVEASELIAAAQFSKAFAEQSKIVGIEAAAAVGEAWRAQGKRIVLANGVFDLLHPGHIRLLQSAKAEGDKLVLALNSDASTRRLKGPGRPIQSEAARAFVIASMAAVDLVVVFGEDTPLKIIEAMRPDVLVKGADYTEAQVVGGDFVRRMGGRVVLVPLEEGYSTTAAIRTAISGVAKTQGS